MCADAVGLPGDLDAAVGAHRDPTSIGEIFGEQPPVDAAASRHVQRLHRHGLRAPSYGAPAVADERRMRGRVIRWVGCKAEGTLQRLLEHRGGVRNGPMPTMIELL